MSKERLPERSGWKEGLEDPGVLLPEWGAANKEAVWDRLHARLGKSPRRIGAAWYWAAAACLLLIIGAVGLFRKASPRPSASHEPAIVSAGPKALEPPPFVAKNTVDDSVGVPSGRALRGARRLAPIPNAGSHRQRSLHPALADLQPPGQPSAPIIISSPSLLSGIATKIALHNPVPRPIPGKELKVIPINELDHTPTNGSSLARVPLSGSFRFQWSSRSSIEEGSPAATSPDPRPSNNSFLKINLSPQN